MESSHKKTFCGGVCAIAALIAMRQLSKGPTERPSNADPNESQEARSERLSKKFAPKDGITFFFFPRSPCARRVWITLLEKGINFNLVMVNLLQGEQRSEHYLKVNPQGKVPAIQVRNVPGIPDCILFESQAIVEWLDEIQWKDTGAEIAESLYLSLYPIDPLSRVEVKMWQYWELSLAEEFWPLSRQQLKEWSGGDAFFENKARNMYNGTYLSQAVVKKCILRILRGFSMLENSLTQDDSPTWLVNNTFSQADITVYPRLTKAPQNGILSNSHQRKQFPNVIKLFNKIAKRKQFSIFKWRDAVIWSSGVFPRFASLELGWWGWLLPWSVIVQYGNWNAGNTFRRFTLGDFESEIADTIKNTPQAIPRNIESFGDEMVLYYSTELPLSCSVQVMIAKMKLPNLRFKKVNTFLLEHLNSKMVACSLLPVGKDAISVTKRAHVRKWFGWVRTAYHYQLTHCYDAMCKGPNLRDSFKDKDILLKSLQPSSTSTLGTEDVVEALEAWANATNDEKADLEVVSPYIDALFDRLK